MAGALRGRSQSGALSVVAGLVPAIYVKPCAKVESVAGAVAAASFSHSRPAPFDDVDARDKPGHDGARAVLFQTKAA